MVKDGDHKQNRDFLMFIRGKSVVSKHLVLYYRKIQSSKIGLESRSAKIRRAVREIEERLIRETICYATL